MPKLIIPVGIPACGKTTFARVLTHVNLIVVSTDEIRGRYVKTGALKTINDMSRNKDVFESFHMIIEDSLLDGMDVYADATNLQPFARKHLSDIAQRVGAEMHLIVFTNLSVAVSRNAKRTPDRIVPAEVVVRMLDQYEKALADIPTETYTSLTYIEGVS